MTTEAPTVEEVTTPVERDPRSLYHWSAWVHVGGGAQECPEVDEAAGTCECADSGHFHAWCRLPNTFQHAQIRERALAAKARKMRQLRTDGSDANEILEGEIDILQSRGEEARNDLIEELLGHEWWRDYMVAVREVRETEDKAEGAPEGALLYATIEHDQARLVQLQSLPDDERNQDEFDELTAHIHAYNVAVDEAFKAQQEPKRASLEQAPLDELIHSVRLKRIETESRVEFQQHYAIHEWLTCALRDATETAAPYFRDLQHLERSAPEVIAALKQTFEDLERNAQEAQGN